MITNIIRIAKPYFTNRDAKVMWLLFIAAVIFNLMFVHASVKMSYWVRDFYDALQNYDEARFADAMKWFFIWIAYMLFAFLSKFYFARMLHIVLRRDMTHDYVNRWTKYNSFYGTKAIGKESDNPDQRISQDVREFVEYTMSLFFSLLQAVVTFISFAAILYNLSGSIDFTLFGIEFKIEGYLLWVAIIFNVISTYLFNFFGKPLSKLYYQQEKREADFRYGMFRIRDNAESIALYHAANYENKNLKELFTHVFNNYIRIINWAMLLNGFRNVYFHFTSIIPIVFLSPGYFAKTITFGIMMQAVNAFREINDALATIISAYEQIAALKAVLQRLNEFNEGVDEWHDSSETSHVKFMQDVNHLQLENCDIKLPDGSALFKDYSLDFKADSYLIKGKSGSGKSTLFRTLAGIWPYAEGKVHIPKNKKIAFIPQKAFMINKSLLEVITYPSSPKSFKKAEIINLLQEFGLNNLVPRLNDADEWGRVLSGGEQQKVSLLRVILHKPDIVMLDEATSSMDKQNARASYKLLRQHLPDAQIISIAHTDVLDEFHAQIINVGTVD
jgi:putative ATP-binding cassette transporter